MWKYEHSQNLHFTFKWPVSDVKFSNTTQHFMCEPINMYETINMYEIFGQIWNLFLEWQFFSPGRRFVFLFCIWAKVGHFRNNIAHSHSFFVGVALEAFRNLASHLYFLEPQCLLYSVLQSMLVWNVPLQ